MLPLNLRPKAPGCNLACGVVRKAERIGDWLAEESITEREQDEPKRCVRDVMVFMTDAELGDETADGFKDPAKRVAIARQDHPGGEGSCAAFAEGVEGHVGDFARVGLTGPGLFHRQRDLAIDAVGHEARQFRLKPRSRPEVMEQVGVGFPDFRSDSLQRHGLRSMRKQYAARGFERGVSAFFRAETFASY